MKDLFPKSLLIITGVLGPETNAHATSEMLDLEYTKRMICALSYIFHEFSNHK